ncbi:MAG: FAD-binding protein [Acidimicrobiales bacterium]|nr:FAD-binding protein [Acidimicrobiales bacterium]
MSGVDPGDIEAFAADVGTDDPVCVRGGGSHWMLGGEPAAGVREVVAPSGIAAFDPAEMTVTVGAGTTLVDLAAVLAEAGQEVALEGPSGATVGGVLAVGRSSLRRGRVGAARDALLQATCVGADGRLFSAGGPTVKNVTGYDLCRLLVGSLGTLSLLASVILRTRPVPEESCWLQGQMEPAAVAAGCHRPATLLWDGARTAVRLEGYREDVEASAESLVAELGLEPIEGPPALPPHRSRWDGTLPEGGILEVGSGVVHGPEPLPVPVPAPGVAALGRRIRDGFDPTGRLNPGRDPYRLVA